MTTKLDNLSPDALVYLALIMDMPDILRLCRSNSRFNQYICDNSNFWQRRLQQDYDVNSDEVPPDVTYKDYYAEIYKSYKRAGTNPDQRLLVAATFDLKRDYMNILKNEKLKTPINLIFQGALYNGFEEAIRYMVDNKMVNLNTIRNALYLKSDDVDLFKYLVDNGAYINTYNNDFDPESKKSYGYPLEYAVRKGHRKIAKYLAEKGAEPKSLSSMILNL